MNEKIKSVIEQNCHFTTLGLLNELMQTIHPESMSYAQSKNMLKQLLDNYQIDVVLKAIKYMGKDKTYAYARVQQQSKKISGPEFKDNITDQLMVFKLHGDDWKVWTTAILNLKYLD